MNTVSTVVSFRLTVVKVNCSFVAASECECSFGGYRAEQSLFKRRRHFDLYQPKHGAEN